MLRQGSIFIHCFPCLFQFSCNDLMFPVRIKVRSTAVCSMHWHPQCMSQMLHKAVIGRYIRPNYSITMLKERKRKLALLDVVVMTLLLQLPNCLQVRWTCITVGKDNIAFCSAEEPEIFAQLHHIIDCIGGDHRLTLVSFILCAFIIYGTFLEQIYSRPYN